MGGRTKNRVKQIQGYQSQLKAAITLDKTGAEVTLDLTSAREIVRLLDELISRVRAE